jgi:hypothetical protein
MWVLERSLGNLAFDERNLRLTQWLANFREPQPQPRFDPIGCHPVINAKIMQSDVVSRRQTGISVLRGNYLFLDHHSGSGACIERVYTFVCVCHHRKSPRCFLPPRPGSIIVTDTPPFLYCNHIGALCQSLPSIKRVQPKYPVLQKLLPDTSTAQPACLGAKKQVFSLCIYRVVQ